MTAVWASMIAVFGTLAGAFLSYRVTRSNNRENRLEARRSEAISAVADLAAALDDHRRAMWLREHHRLSGADARVIADAREASHETRGAITAPLVRVGILVPTLLDLAKQAEQAAYALRNAPDLDKLSNLRTAALQANDRLISEASQVVADLD